jgi:hypothetical protein
MVGGIEREAGELERREDGQERTNCKRETAIAAGLRGALRTGREGREKRVGRCSGAK